MTKKMNLAGNPSENFDQFGEVCVGIDLGTTNCAVSVLEKGSVPRILPIGKDNTTTVPSCVLWENGEFIVGAEAYAKRYQENCVYSVKRIMGTDSTVKLVDGGNEKIMTPAEVSSIILKYLKDRVHEIYGKVFKCVITVPAYFNQRQIEDTLTASTLAGWECLHILKEPTAASYVYSGLGNVTNGDIIIYDLGGGTFDVTHLTLVRKDTLPKQMLKTLNKLYGIELQNTGNSDNHDKYFCRVIGTYGDMMLGGDDIDRLAAEQILDGRNVDRETKEKLILVCEQIKKSGYHALDTTINGQEFHITKAEIDAATEKIYKRTKNIMQKIDHSKVHSIILVGGSTKSSIIRTLLQQDYPNAEISCTLNPDETVAQGAGSLGASIVGKKELPYQDVLPLPIGILVDDSTIDFCLQKNTSIPHSAKRTFYNLVDNQKNISIVVYQGLSENPVECVCLGTARIEGLPPAKAGELAVTVTFTINAKGRLKITASLNDTDKEVSFTVDNIFSVKQKNISMEFADDFEEIFYKSFVKSGNQDGIDLLMQRREAKTEEEKEAIEDKILML